MRLIGLVLALGLTLAPLSAEAESDYGREKKWANEIVPGIVVGDPVFLEDLPLEGFRQVCASAASGSRSPPGEG